MAAQSMVVDGVLDCVVEVTASLVVVEMGCSVVLEVLLEPVIGVVELTVDNVELLVDCEEQFPVLTVGVAIVLSVDIADVENELLVEQFPVLEVDNGAIVEPNVVFVVEMLLVD